MPKENEVTLIIGLAAFLELTRNNPRLKADLNSGLLREALFILAYTEADLEHELMRENRSIPDRLIQPLEAALLTERIAYVTDPRATAAAHINNLLLRHSHNPLDFRQWRGKLLSFDQLTSLILEQRPDWRVYNFS